MAVEGGHGEEMVRGEEGRDLWVAGRRREELYRMKRIKARMGRMRGGEGERRRRRGFWRG
ncbi:MAG: hypothetical protein ABFD96_22580 [Armatimonadia bacterium]